jgi:hypothetical protein
MVDTRAQKRTAAERRNPLYYSGILQHTLSYVGPGHWLLLSTVSRLWKTII